MYERICSLLQQTEKTFIKIATSILFITTTSKEKMNTNILSGNGISCRLFYISDGSGKFN